MDRATERARETLRHAAAQRANSQRAEKDAIVAALQAGARQVDVVADSGYSREQIRRIARGAGIAPRKSRR